MGSEGKFFPSYQKHWLCLYQQVISTAWKLLLDFVLKEDQVWTQSTGNQEFGSL